MLNVSDTTGAILAGGLGTRLRSVVADRPKVMADVCGRPFLAFLLNQLAEAGIRKTVLCTGHMGEQIRNKFGASYKGMRLAYSQEATPLGTGGAIRLAAPLFESDSVLVLNGDSYCEADLQAFCRWHDDRESKASLLLTRVPDTSRYGRVITDTAGLVRDFKEKLPQHEPGWVNAGIYLLNRDLIMTIPWFREISLERKCFPSWLRFGLHALRTHGQFLDIGTPESYAAVERFFLQDALT